MTGELRAIFKKNIETVERTRSVLAAYGIKFIVLSHPEKCAVDGVSLWSNGNPAIGSSLRHKRIDYFAFTVMHELGHIFLHLVNNNTAEFIDLEKDADNASFKRSKEEKEADEFSKNNLINNEQWAEYMTDHPYYYEDDIVSFARKMEIHAAVVLGRYCFETGNFKIKSGIDKTLH